MSTTSERIKNAIENAGLSYGELSRRTGIPKAALQRYATGETAKVPVDRVEKIARATAVTTGFLLGWDAESEVASEVSRFDNVFPIHVKKFPLLGEIACGEPIYATEDRESYVMASTLIPADFCLRAKGDSMVGARILDGDIVFIRKQPTVENGEIAAVIIGDEATLKRVYYYPAQSKLVLNAENPKYEPFVFVGAELDSIRILGKAIAFQSDIV
ncbi:MAG: helix-turn-helix domain-containing protein [Roseburia sp.]|nr:helix-turn-helix domain-containing protein [Roseburia sp.]